MHRVLTGRECRSTGFETLAKNFLCKSLSSWSVAKVELVIILCHYCGEERTAKEPASLQTAHHHVARQREKSNALQYKILFPSKLLSRF